MDALPNQPFMRRRRGSVAAGLLHGACVRQKIPVLLLHRMVCFELAPKNRRRHAAMVAARRPRPTPGARRFSVRASVFAVPKGKTPNHALVVVVLPNPAARIADEDRKTPGAVIPAWTRESRCHGWQTGRCDDADLNRRTRPTRHSGNSRSPASLIPRREAPTRAGKCRGPSFPLGRGNPDAKDGKFTDSTMPHLNR